MSERISDYVNTATSFITLDLFDVSKKISSSPDVFQTQKFTYGTLTSALVAYLGGYYVDLTNAQNISGTKSFTSDIFVGLATYGSGGMSTYDGTTATQVGSGLIGMEDTVAGATYGDSFYLFKNGLLQYDDASTTFNFSLAFPQNIIGAHKTVNFRDLAGTVALLTDLSGYAPLANPNFTGTAKFISTSSIEVDITGQAVTLKNGTTRTVIDSAVGSNATKNIITGTTSFTVNYPDGAANNSATFEDKLGLVALNAVSVSSVGMAQYDAFGRLVNNSALPTTVSSTTLAAGTNTTQLATTAFVTAAINASTSGGGGVYYVSKIGNDSLAVKGNSAKPWLTIDAALIAANSTNSSVVIKYISGSVSVVINGVTYSASDPNTLSIIISGGANLITTISGNNITVTTVAASFICDPGACTGQVTLTARTIVETATVVVLGGDYTVTNSIYKDGVNFGAIGVVNITRSGNLGHLINVEPRSVIGQVISGNFNLFATGTNANVFNYALTGITYYQSNNITIKVAVLSLIAQQSQAIYINCDIVTVSSFDFDYVTALSNGGNAVYTNYVTAKQNIFINCLQSNSSTTDAVEIAGTFYQGMCNSTTGSNKYALILHHNCKFSGSLLSSSANHLNIVGDYNQVEQVGVVSLNMVISGNYNVIESKATIINNSGQGNEFDMMGSCVGFTNSGSAVLRNLTGSPSIYWNGDYAKITNSGNLLVKDFICNGTNGMWMNISAGTVTLDTDFDIISNNITISGGTLIVNKRLRALQSANNDDISGDLIVWFGGNIILRPGAILIKSHVDANIISSNIIRAISVYSCFTNQDFRTAVKRKDNCTVGGTIVVGEVYTDIINLVSYNVAAVAGDTSTSIVAKLIIAIAAAPVVATNNGTNYDIVANVAGTNYTRTVSKTAGTGTIFNLRKISNNSANTTPITGASISVDTTNLL
jgi:hypothetical protein